MAGVMGNEFSIYLLCLRRVCSGCQLFAMVLCWIAENCVNYGDVMLVDVDVDHDTWSVHVHSHAPQWMCCCVPHRPGCRVVSWCASITQPENSIAQLLLSFITVINYLLFMIAVIYCF
jgi:hypothetical protein